MILVLGSICAVTLMMLAGLAMYQWVFAIAGLWPRGRRHSAPGTCGRLIVLIPAHDEEAGLATTLANVRGADYPPECLQIVVVADRCSDATAAVARRGGALCLERADGQAGKGAAIAWALQQLRSEGATFDGLVILDADTVVERGALRAFDESLRLGHEAQQGYNYLSNPWDTPFTRIIAVTSVLRNELFYAGKERLGITSMLSGTGMCFSRRILERIGWNAFSVGEDWEFSVSLLLAGERIHFNRQARVRATESRGFCQASTQRLRWASGRHGVAASSTRTLLSAGLRQRRLDLWDAATTLLAPTYSSQGALAVLSLAIAVVLRDDPPWHVLLPFAVIVAGLLGAYFTAGLMLTDAPMRAVVGILLIPAFLPWRVCIELLGALGYGRRRWVRTSRISTLALLCAVSVPRQAPAQILFQDDFEDTAVNADGTLLGWDGPANSASMYLSGAQSFSGRRSLELNYVPGTFGASFMYRLFAGRDHVYFRWYQRWSPGFVWEPSATKMVILRPMGGYPQFYPEVMWGAGEFAIQAQVIAEANWDSRNFSQNIGVPIKFQANRWYCVEVFVKLNTPGSADGQLAAWIDGDLKLSYDHREFRGATPQDPAPSSATIQAIGLTGYYGGITTVPLAQTSWQDDVVASAERIGPDLVAEDFETDSNDLPGWDGPTRPSTMFASADRSLNGFRSLELAYVEGTNGAGYAYKHFGAQERVYVRWFQRWSANFTWNPWATGLLGLRPRSGYPQFYPLVASDGRGLAIQAQVLADREWGSENLFQNIGDPLVLEPERWVCFEVMVQLNTPGLSDGALAAWIDDRPALLYEGRAFRGSSPTDPSPPDARLAQFLILGQYGGPTMVPHAQTSWLDDFIVSPQRIGCSAPARTIR